MNTKTSKTKADKKLVGTVYKLDGKEAGSIELKEEIFGAEINRHIVAEVIRWQLAKRRAGTHSTKTRSDVRGTTKKFKPQKEQGTRHADKRAPIFRKGGICHGPKPRDYTYSLNRKIKTLGLKMALSNRVNAGALKILENLDLSSHKTADFKKTVDVLSLSKALIVSENFDDKIVKAAGNIPNINLLKTAGLNVYDIIKHHQLVITKDSLEAIYSRFAN